MKFNVLLPLANLEGKSYAVPRDTGALAPAGIIEIPKFCTSPVVPRTVGAAPVNCCPLKVIEAVFFVAGSPKVQFSRLIEKFFTALLFAFSYAWDNWPKSTSTRSPS